MSTSKNGAKQALTLGFEEAKSMMALSYTTMETLEAAQALYDMVARRSSIPPAPEEEELAVEESSAA